MNEPIRKKIRVECSREHAFVTFIEKIDLWWPKGHRKFGSSKMHLEAKIGGSFVEESTEGERWELGRVIKCDPPRMIAYTWFPGALSGPTLVSVFFAEDGDGTLVSVVHREGEAELGDLWPERAALFERGWSTVLPLFGAAINARR